MANSNKVTGLSVKEVEETRDSSKVGYTSENKDEENGKQKEKGYWYNYPYSVFCIIGNEFCERFSFYGMTAILMMYLNRGLLFSTSQSTMIFHTFVMLCYITPILGALICDGWLGKYRTILYVSILYAFGNALMSITAIPFGGSFGRVGPLIALFIIALGTGGIKPCVSSFGADQFNDDQDRQKKSFFSMFYACMNIAAIISGIVTPLLRSDVYCFDTNCYSVAFGVPAILMTTAVIFFVSGSKWYNIVPPGDNIIRKLIVCIWTALKGKCFCNKVPEEEKKEHWLDYAEIKFDKPFIRDVKDIMGILWIFLPLPFYFALVSQQGSTWTLQAGQLNGNEGNIVIQPDQVPVINPILVVLLLPFLDAFVYPCLTRIGIPHRHLQRMGFGMFLTATSFLMAAGLQVVINNSMPAAVPNGITQYKFVNAAPCNVTLVTPNVNDKSYLLDYQEGTSYFSADAGNIQFEISESTCSGYNNGAATAVLENMEQTKSYIVPAMVDINTKEFVIKSFHQSATDRTLRGESTTWIINALSREISVNLKTTGNQEKDPHEFNNITAYNVSYHDKLITAKFYVYLMKDGDTIYESPGLKIGEIDSENGAVSTLVIQESTNGQSIEVVQHTDVTQNSVNILWQIPQYFVITLGECFFSVTGLSFTYMQAPASMKVIVMACWLLTAAIGNLVVIIVELITSNLDQVAQFVVFAVLLYVVLVIFVFMSFHYDYVEEKLDLTEDEDETKCNVADGLENTAYEYIEETKM